MPDPDLDLDLDTAAQRIAYDFVSRPDAVRILIEMIETLKARNQALVAHIAESALRNDPGTVVIRIGHGDASTAMLAWRDEGHRIHRVVL